jgi:murein DD-endopeptidase MepM/ murein hydrolase activator NlpD
MFGDDDESGSGLGKGPLADALYAELGQALSRSGGLGLGESMIEPLLRATGGSHAANVAAVGGTAGLGSLSSRAMHAPIAATPVTIGTAAGGSASWTPSMTSAYGWRRDPIDGGLKFHKGADIAMPVGQSVPAARAGRVVFAGEMSGYGLTVLLDHGGDVATRYAHLSQLSVQAGDQVAEGQTIALSGASGRVTGPHLHVELLEGGRPVDPAGRLGLAGLSITVSD